MGIDHHLSPGGLHSDIAVPLSLQHRPGALLYHPEPDVEARHCAGRQFMGKYHPLVPVHAEIAGLFRRLAGDLLPIAVDAWV